MNLTKTLVVGAVLSAGLFAQDLRIVRAQYGHDSRWADVTETLRRSVRGGRLDVIISNDLFRMDPAPAEVKSLRVEYLIDGRRFNDEFPENSRLVLPNFGPGRDRDRDRDDRERFGERGLIILSAQYGFGNRFVDVTRIVRGYVRDGQLRMRVSNDTMGGDPFRGPDKVLRVEYSYNGRRDAVEVREDSDLFLPRGGAYVDPVPPPPPPPAYGARLAIISARYGANGRFVDVTRIVRGYVRDGQLRMRVSNDTMGGDPLRGADKVLLVEFEVNGQRMRREFREDSDMFLP